MTIIKKTTINARQDGEKGTLIHHWSEYKWAQPLITNMLFKKLKW
jgi:hypothetical protein